MCVKIERKLYEYETSDELNMNEDENCSEEIISISSMNEKQAPIKENLLHCKYSDLNKHRPDEKINAKALGRGQGPYDVMEYEIINGKAEPIRNRTEFLKEVSVSYFQNKFALTFEEHNDLKG